MNMKVVKAGFVGLVLGVAGTLLIGISTKSFGEAEQDKKIETYEMYDELRHEMLVLSRYEGYNQGYRQGYLEIQNIMKELPKEKEELYEEYVKIKNKYESDPKDENFEKLEDITAKAILEYELVELASK